MNEGSKMKNIVIDIESSVMEAEDTVELLETARDRLIATLGGASLLLKQLKKQIMEGIE